MNAPPAPGHEGTDLDGRVVIIAAVAILLTMTLVAVAAHAILRGLRAPLPIASAPPPTLSSSDPRAALAIYQTQQQARLNSYGWVNRQQGIAHIPIERAMQLLTPGQTAEPSISETQRQ